MKEKLILFDWGNIVESHSTGYSCYDAWRDLFASCGYNGGEEFFSALSRYKLTRIGSIEEFIKSYEQLSEEFGFSASFEEFVMYYKQIFDKIDYYKDVAEYEISLRDKCYIGIFSNLTIFDKERLEKQVGLANYDYVFLSFEMNLRKPEMEIYNQVQKNVPFKAEDILFIDDKKTNIEAASKAGWNTFQVTGLELDKIKQKCESFLGKD